MRNRDLYRGMLRIAGILFWSAAVGVFVLVIDSGSISLLVICSALILASLGCDKLRDIL